MNILLLTAGEGLTGISLCTTHGGTYCALAGEVVAAGGAAAVMLRDTEGTLLHQSRIPLFALPGAAHIAGVLHTMKWLSERNIRVDLVAHHIAHPGEHDYILRVAPEQVAPLGEFEACRPAVYCIEAVAATVKLPQVAFFAVRPHTDLEIACAIASAGLHAPAGCPKKLKVRCETCCVN